VLLARVLLQNDVAVSKKGLVVELQFCTMSGEPEKKSRRDGDDGRNSVEEASICSKDHSYIRNRFAMLSTVVNCSTAAQVGCLSGGE